METTKALSEIPFDLQVLKLSRNYQQWMVEAVAPYLGDRILEVGAGIGNMSRWLPIREKLVVSEADKRLISELREVMRQTTSFNPDVRVEAVNLDQDWLQGLRSDNFDTIVSFNVIEHIEDDKKALSDFVELLKSSTVRGPKRIVTVVPAHQWIYGSMDDEYGHYRRYSKRRFKQLAQAIAPEARLYCEYFNLFSLPGWVVMGKVLKKRQIGPESVVAFEKVCPYIKGVDRFLHQKLRLPLGQSIISVLTLPA